MKKEVKFKTPKETANDVVDIIGNTLNLGVTTKSIFKGGLSIKNDDDIRVCLTNLLKLLINEYKK